MKTTKITSVILLFTVIAFIGLNTTSASYGEGKGQGKNMTAEQREELQNMSEEEREEYREANGMEMKDDDHDGISNRDDDDYERDHDNYERDDDDYNKSEYSERGRDGDFENRSSNSRANDELKAKYKNTYEEKYGDAISRMSDDQLNTFISKVDDISDKIENGNYSVETKEKYNAILGALKEIAEDNLYEEDDLLDGLF